MAAAALAGFSPRISGMRAPVATGGTLTPIAPRPIASAPVRTPISAPAPVTAPIAPVNRLAYPVRAPIVSPVRAPIAYPVPISSPIARAPISTLAPSLAPTGGIMQAQPLTNIPPSGAPPSMSLGVPGVNFSPGGGDLGITTPIGGFSVTQGWLALVAIVALAVWVGSK